MKTFLEKFSDRLDVLDLDLPDLAGLLLEYLHSIQDIQQRRNVMRTNYVKSMVPEGAKRHEVSRAIMEAWCWLIREGYLIPYPAEHSAVDGFEFSRLGLKAKTRQEFA
jgi:hypothetical protein